MAKAPAPEAKSDNNSPEKAICGIIMPIAAMLPKYEASHWADVRKVIDAAIEKAGMIPQIVSDSFEGDVIQRRIISNLYENPVVVCDVSGLNPNVMFELGMRITFKQPVIIITDDFATIPFDTKVIEHLGYPRDLHIHQTNEFIIKLSDRISRLHDKKKSGEFTSFIEEFGTFEVLEPQKKVVEADQLILDQIIDLGRRLDRIQPDGIPWPIGALKSRSQRTTTLSFKIHELASMHQITEIAEAINTVMHLDGSAQIMKKGARYFVEVSTLTPKSAINSVVEEVMNYLSDDVRGQITAVDVT